MSDDRGHGGHGTTRSDSHQISRLHSLGDQASAEGARKIPQFPIGHGLLGICQRDGIGSIGGPLAEKSSRTVQFHGFTSTEIGASAIGRGQIVMLSHAAVGETSYLPIVNTLVFTSCRFQSVQFWATQS